MKASPDVLVIGGGVIGLTAAYEFASAGLRVEICDRGDLGREASWAGAGLIPPGNAKRTHTPWDHLRAVSSERFASFAKQLHDETGIDPGYLPRGGIEFLHDHERSVVPLWESEGVTYELLDDVAIRRLCPNLGQYEGGPFYLPGMAQVRNPRLLQALIAACDLRGVVLRTQCNVELLRSTDSKLDGVRINGSEVRTASHYIIAAGSWSQRLLDSLGCSLNIHPVRGQLLLYQASEQLLMPTLIHGKEYIVPRSDGKVIVGSTLEPEAGFDKTPTAETLDSLAAFGRRILPKLANATLEAHWSGLRPGARDGIPFIGAVPGYDNILAAVGHYRSGIQLSLGTATMLADLILHRTPTVDPTAFRLDRPPMPPVQLAFRS